MPNSSPAEIAQRWLDSIGAAFASKDIKSISSHFMPTGFWRDHLVVEFDLNSWKAEEVPSVLQKSGVPGIKNLKVVKPHDAAIAVVSPEMTWLSAFIEFETSEIRGQGFIRLVQSVEGKWEAFTFFTSVKEVIGHENNSHYRRPLGTLHGESEGMRKNWLDRRQEKVKFETTEPTVIILGGGQNGLMLAARLEVMGIDCLVIEKNKRVGDSWRLRYHTLALHDPIHADSFPFLEYPAHFPTFLPKDKLANWMEFYADAMELNVWLNSTMEPNPIYDEATKKWAVTIVKDGTPRVVNTAHLVLATGFSGEARMPSFPRDEFKGQVFHSSTHKGAELWKGKSAVVIGACNSSHDIAQDFFETGVKSVTMVQRSHTYVMSSEHGLKGLLAGFYEEGAPPLADADIMLTSLPVNLLEQFHIGATKEIAVKDKVLLDGLRGAGFKINQYAGGLFIKYFRDGGGYYIDVGCSQLIIDGKVKLKQGQEVEKLTPTGVLFADGTHIDADIVVCATGYSSMKRTVARVVSEDVAGRLRTVWGADAQGEIPSVWRNSGVEGFWLAPGNFFQARTMSREIALQIQMIETGLRKKTRAYPDHKEVVDPRF